MNKLIKNRYKIIDKINEGGMSEIFLAYDEKKSIKVIIKIILKGYVENELVSNSFELEYQAIQKIQSKYIVNIIDYFIYKKRKCIVLEYINGYSLRDRLNEFGPSLEKEVIYYTKNICLGIQDAHKYNIIHRDLKPENILISYNGEIKVADFGVAILDLNKYVIKNKIIGTAKYLAPEIVQGMMPSFQTDIYAIGIIMYELLTGAAPFVGGTPPILAAKHVKEIPLPLNKIVSDVSNKMINVINKCLSKNPKDRYNNISELLKEIKALENGEEDKRIFRTSNKILIKNKKYPKTKVLRISDRYRYLPYFLNYKIILLSSLLSMLLLFLSILIGFID